MRTDCSPATGCHHCGRPLENRRRAFCCDACRDEHYDNHSWAFARKAALLRHRECQDCGRRTCLEVHHKVPLNSSHEYGTWSCKHHQENLRVLCVSCHKATHVRLRGNDFRQGPFGWHRKNRLVWQGTVAQEVLL